MSVRVVGGMYGGRKLSTPPGDKTHPMGERIRNALFNSLNEQIHGGVTVLDAFAGTGAVGIEALSRGAEYVTFVEKDKVAQNCIQNSLAELKITNAKLIKTSVGNWLQSYDGGGVDIIFADPPYDDTQLETIKKLTQVLRPGGIFVLSWPESEPAPQISDSLWPFFNRVYAGARIIIYGDKPDYTK